MDLSFTAEEIAFRDEVRAFFEENVDPTVRAKLMATRHISKDELVTWQRVLNKTGWGVPHWPVEYGGTGWSAVKQYIFLEELQKFPAPPPLPFGVNMVGPVIYTFGNEAQKKHYLPRIANMDDWWCQGFSEPGAGSDLASLKTTAKKSGDTYVVNGQKTWTTLGQYADWIFCLCRTDPEAKKQSGISFILIDMRSKGITCRPIQMIDGGSRSTKCSSMTSSCLLRISLEKKTRGGITPSSCLATNGSILHASGFRRRVSAASRTWHLG
jgi:alkylation response protein AidB-like acyl-CoA dehydrogenase